MQTMSVTSVLNIVLNSGLDILDDVVGKAQNSEVGLIP